MIVKVEVLLVSPGAKETGFGLNVGVAPAGRLELMMLSEAVKAPDDPPPEPRVTVTVYAAEVPGMTVHEEGLTATDPTLGESVNVVAAVEMPSVAVT